MHGKEIQTSMPMMTTSETFAGRASSVDFVNAENFFLCIVALSKGPRSDKLIASSVGCSP